MTIISFQDSVTMFRHSVVQRGDDLIWVGEVQEAREDEHCKLLGFKMDDASPIKLDADPDVVLAPTRGRLGFVNIPGSHSMYLTRQPWRQYKVGWGEGSVRGWVVAFTNKYRAQFLDMVNGKYPSYEEVREKAAKGAMMTAFDKQWAMHGSDVYYCNQLVGTVRSGKCTVPAHLRENLAKSGGVVA